jgi:hypothetical protein
VGRARKVRIADPEADYVEARRSLLGDAAIDFGE